MRICYVGYGDFHRYAGMKQLYHFAQEICRLGHQAQILIAGMASTVASMDEPPSADIVEMAFTGPLLKKRVRQCVLDFKPDILHVWTPRHVPALAGWQLQRLTKARLILDHEDDEKYHLNYAKQTLQNRWQIGYRRWLVPIVVIRNTIQPWLIPLRYDGLPFRATEEPITSHLVAGAAKAHTAISPKLVAQVQQKYPPAPVYLLYPGANLQLFSPTAIAPDLRDKLGLAGKRIVVYSGTMDVRVFHWFMQALSGVVRKHPDVVLLLVGDDSIRDEAAKLARREGLESHYRLVAQVPYLQVASYLGLADVLIQHPLDLGNSVRLPAKLPEYLAMGKAVITYAQGIGEILQDGLHVRKLYTIDPLEAARVICDLIEDPKQRAMLGTAARQFAQTHFEWSEKGRQLLSIYQSVLGY